MSHRVDVVWGSFAAGLYRSGVFNLSVRLAHSTYRFERQGEASAFLLGVAAARDPLDWSVVKPEHLESMGPPVSEILFGAVEAGDVRAVVHLVNIGVPATLFDQQGYTLLHRACQEGHEQVVDALIEAGADPNAISRDKLKCTVLHVCVVRDGVAQQMCLEHLLGARACNRRRRLR